MAVAHELLLTASHFLSACQTAAPAENQAMQPEIGEVLATVKCSNKQKQGCNQS